MTMNNEFYKVVNNQIRMQVEKNGDEMITLDPALDQKKQNEQIKQLVKRKVDAIFLNSVDWKEVESGLKAAKKAKIPVIVIDSQVYRNDLSLSICRCKDLIVFIFLDRICKSIDTIYRRSCCIMC